MATKRAERCHMATWMGQERPPCRTLHHPTNVNSSKDQGSQHLSGCQGLRGR